MGTNQTTAKHTTQLHNSDDSKKLKKKKKFTIGN
jgi:hypothetical protein